MFTHVAVGTSDPERAVAFYDAVMGTLGISGERHDRGAYYGNYEEGFFSVGLPRDGQPATHANGGTIGFPASSSAMVDAWHAAGIANGGTCDGPPGPREYGPEPMYGAYLRDPTGNKLCTFYRGTGE